MQRASRLRFLVLVEALLCFALPAYFLIWGIVTLPVWIIGAQNDSSFARLYAWAIAGGCLGLWAILSFLRTHLGQRTQSKRLLSRNVAFAVVGLLSLWLVFTEGFSAVHLDTSFLLLVIVPTACTLHLAWLAFRAARRSGAARDV
jgi:hypothetical protein